MALTWKGDWLNLTSYVGDDVVYSRGSSYVCTNAHVSSPDTEPGGGGTSFWPLFWTPFAIGEEGEQGEQGEQGEKGEAGYGLRYRFNNDTVFPSTISYIKFNATDYTLVTQISVHRTDRLSTDVSVALDIIAANTVLHIFSEANDNRMAYYKVTTYADSGSTRVFTVSYVGHIGTFQTNEELTLGWVGLTGSAGTGDISGPASSVDNEVALYSGTTGKLLKRASSTGVAILTSGVLSVKTNPTGAFVGDTDTQTLTNKTLTQPTLTLKQSTTPAPTAEGDLQWDTDDNKIAVGDGVATKIISPDDVTATLTNKRLDSPKLNENVVVTATATEVNYNDITTLGAVEASKTVTADASRNATSAAGILTWLNMVATSGFQFNSPQGFGTNYRITKSVASNNLTVSLKLLDGSTDASSSAPIAFRIGNTIRSLTAALSLTLNAGTNYFNRGATELAAKDLDYFVYVGWRASNASLFILLSPLPNGKTFGDFSGTSTSSRYGAASGTAPASTDEVELIGRINLTLGVTASFNWSLPATAVDYNEPIYHTRTFSYIPPISLVGTGTAPTYTGGNTTGWARIDRFTATMAMTMQNTAGGTAGSGTGYVAYGLPIESISVVVGEAPVGSGQYYNSAAGEIGVTHVASTTLGRVVRSNTAFVTGADQNNATRFLIANPTYSI